VASATNLWALIMDAGTGFSSQVYELSAVFLHKVVILKALISIIFLECLYETRFIDLLYYSVWILIRTGLWNNGKRIFISVQ
jgi:hypothetical protein